MKQEVIDILDKYYNVPKEDVLETMLHQRLFESGYGMPAERGVHAMHFPEDPGEYYVIVCRGKDCSICKA